MVKSIRITEHIQKKQKHIFQPHLQKMQEGSKGDLIIATTSENDEDVCKAVAWLGSEDIAVSSDACIYKHNLNPKYVSYFFKQNNSKIKKTVYYWRKSSACKC